MTHILYLAAGHSRRYGAENKLLVERNGKPLYRWGLDRFRAVIAERSDCTLTVVTCWQEILTECRSLGVRTVYCPDSANGISYTIRAGIQSLDALTAMDYLCFSVADQPAITSETITHLLDVATERPMTASLWCNGQPGNPTLFSAALAEELLALTGDKGGKSVMRRHPENHINVPCAPEELLDIDEKSLGSQKKENIP